MKWAPARAQRLWAAGPRRGVLAIAGGTAAGQLVALAVLPLLTRLYTPAEFGAFAVLSAMAVMTSAVLSLRWEKAVPLPALERDALAVTQLALGAAWGLALVALPAVIVLDSHLAGWSGAADTATWWWTVPVAGALAASFAVLGQLAVRDHRYNALGVRNALQPSVTSLVQLLLAWVVAGPAGLIWGYLTGRLAGLPGLVRGSGLGGSAGRAGRSRRVLIAVARRYRRFPLVGMPAGLLNLAGLQIPTILVARQYGAEVAGPFGLAVMVAALPVTLVAVAIGQVFLGQMAARLRQGGQVGALFSNTSRRLAVLALVVALALAVILPPVLRWLLAEEWALASQLMPALGVLAAVRFWVTPITHTLPALELQGRQFLLDALRVAVILGCFSWAAATGSAAEHTVWVYAALMCAVYVLTWLVCRSAAHRPPARVAMDTPAGEGRDE